MNDGMLETVATVLFITLVLGIIGAISLQSGNIIAGAALFLVSGILVGALLGYILSFFDEGD